MVAATSGNVLIAEKCLPCRKMSSKIHRHIWGLWVIHHWEQHFYACGLWVFFRSSAGKKASVKWGFQLNLWHGWTGPSVAFSLQSVLVNGASNRLPICTISAGLSVFPIPVSPCRKESLSLLGYTSHKIVYSHADMWRPEDFRCCFLCHLPLPPKGP